MSLAGQAAAAVADGQAEVMGQVLTQLEERTGADVKLTLAGTGEEGRYLALINGFGEQVELVARNAEMAARLAIVVIEYLAEAPAAQGTAG